MEESNDVKKDLGVQFQQAGYNAVFNAVSDAIFINDIETKRIIDVNEKACEMFCYPREELLNLGVADLSVGEGPFTGEEWIRLLDKAASGEEQLFEWLVRDKAGRPFWIEVNAARAVMGGKYRLLAVVRDIHDRKQAEERLVRMNEVFLSFGADPAENINALTALCGELLWADRAFYSRLEDGRLHPCGQWRITEAAGTVDMPDGRLSYDVIRKGPDEIVLIRDLSGTEYARTDPDVSKYNLETYLGRAVRVDEKRLGALGLFYQRDFEPTDEDREVLNTIASAIGIEERRSRALKAEDSRVLCELELAKKGEQELKKELERTNEKLKNIKKGMPPQNLAESKDLKLLKDKAKELTRRGRRNLIESISAFAKTIKLKDYYTGKHVEDTVHYSTEIARKLGLAPKEIDDIKQASILHDLGKIGISDKILLKRSKLTKEEFEAIKRHPQIAADIIKPIQFMHDIIPLILYHHERWDGKGYPGGLKRDDIPIGARIIAVADVYQALTSNRPYRKAYSRKKALEIIKKGAGTHFDPKVVNIFLEIIEKKKP